MTKVEDLLATSLVDLMNEMEGLEGKYSAQFIPIREALARGEARGLNDAAFLTNLKELAEAVIEVRKKAAEDSPLRRLPVPPYDLYLPFKAGNTRSSDSRDLASQTPVSNQKLREFWEYSTVKSSLKEGAKANPGDKAQHENR